MMNDETELPEVYPDQLTFTPRPGAEKLEGTVVRITYCNPETLYTVAVLRLADKREVTITGSLAGLRPAEELRAYGAWKATKQYGQQFAVEQFEQILPTDSAAIEAYLASGLIKGIGPVYASRMIAAFGTDVFKIIEESPERLRKVEGIGKKRFDQIVRSWEEQRALRDIIMFLQLYGIGINYAARVYRQYGAKAIEQLKKNPYQLALDIWGIAFKTADAIATKLGIPHESVERSKAGVYYCLQEDSGRGNCFSVADDLILKSQEMLDVGVELVYEGITKLAEEQLIKLDVLNDAESTRAVYLTRLFKHEESVAKQIERIVRAPKHLPQIPVEQGCTDFETQNALQLAPNQRVAIEAAVKGGVLVITGGPGTGKTTIIRAILNLLEAHGVTFMLAAPTGRAAKRMQETTGRFAMTLHRMLKFSPAEGGWQVNATSPLKTDVVIVDESSMVDVALADALLKGVMARSSVIFVGDCDQLPSVGPGNFLRDVMNSGVVPVVRLNEIFRQGQHSLIVTNAHKINSGEYPVIPQPEGGKLPKSDFIFIPAETPELGLAYIRKLVSVTLPQMFKYDPFEDIQVLSPQRKSGLVGTVSLNRDIQQTLNPKGLSMTRGEVFFRVGDKVMQTENNYDKDVFNGDIGRVTHINPADQEMTVDFDGKSVTYGSVELDELQLAYAITVHKSQGSEYKCVVIPLMTQHFMMLQRNLIYTAITRGKKRVVVVGQKRALRMAIDNASGKPRNSALGIRLQALFA